MKKSLLLILLCALLSRAGTAQAAPRLLVVISVDQMRADYLDRFASQFQGGFKLLREQGAVFTDAHHVHIPTETGPGHAVILTGRFPDRTGIVGNTWWDRSLSTEVYCVADSVHGLGPEHLLTYTLGDALKAQDPRSQVVSISLKDRAAILLGGKKPDTALWYDKRKGEFTTSSYYARPTWLEKFNKGLKAKGGPLFGDTTAQYQELIYEPKADRVTLMLVEEAARRFKLGRGKHSDLLAISFSATDYIGHRYGPDSDQMRAQLLSLDAELGELFSYLDRRVGRGFYDVALTADHGVTPRPEDPSGQAQGIKRMMYDELGARLEKALQYQFPSQEPWLINEYPNLYVNRAQVARLGLDWTAFLRNAVGPLQTAEGVAKIYIGDEIDPADPYADAYKRSYMPGRSGDFLVRVSTEVLVTDRPTGADHGSPYLNDTHVPMVFWGPDFKTGSYTERAWVADLAPTCGAVLGVDFPPAEGSRVHGEAIVKP